MFNRSPRSGRVISTLIAAALMAACSSGEGPVAPSTASLGGALASSSDSWDPAHGSIQLCKLAPNVSAATWADFTVVASSGALPLGASFRLNAGSTFPGNCATVWLPTGLSGSWTASVTISEVGMTPGMSLHVTSVFPAGGGRADYYYADGNTVEVMVGSGAGARVIFKNQGSPDVPPPPPPPTGAGCTPGFWRQAHHHQYWTTYSPGQAWTAAFANPGSWRGPGKNGETLDGSTTLGAAVQLGGGEIFALARHGVAALLNASSPEVNYPLTAAQVRSIVNGAISSGNFEAAKNQLAALNEVGCTVVKTQ